MALATAETGRSGVEIAQLTLQTQKILENTFHPQDPNIFSTLITPHRIRMQVEHRDPKPDTFDPTVLALHTLTDALPKGQREDKPDFFVLTANSPATSIPELGNNFRLQYGIAGRIGEKPSLHLTASDTDGHFIPSEQLQEYIIGLSYQLHLTPDMDPNKLREKLAGLTAIEGRVQTPQGLVLTHKIDLSNNRVPPPTLFSEKDLHKAIERRPVLPPFNTLSNLAAEERKPEQKQNDHNENGHQKSEPQPAGPITERRYPITKYPTHTTHPQPNGYSTSVVGAIKVGKQAPIIAHYGHGVLQNKPGSDGGYSADSTMDAGDFAPQVNIADAPPDATHTWISPRADSLPTPSFEQFMERYNNAVEILADAYTNVYLKTQESQGPNALTFTDYVARYRPVLEKVEDLMRERSIYHRIQEIPKTRRQQTLLKRKLSFRIGLAVNETMEKTEKAIERVTRHPRRIATTAAKEINHTAIHLAHLLENTPGGSEFIAALVLLKQKTTVDPEKAKHAGTVDPEPEYHSSTSEYLLDTMKALGLVAGGIGVSLLFTSADWLPRLISALK